MKHTGFTLIELLVVITILAILISLSVPALQAARKQARALICGANLKNLSTALIAYDRMNGTFPYGFDDRTHGSEPPPGDYIGDVCRDRMGWWWFQSALDIQGNDDIDKISYLWCPSRYIKTQRLKRNLLCGNYGVNRSFCTDPQGLKGCEFVGVPWGQDQIRHPDQTLLIVDSGYALISWRAATEISGPAFEFSTREKSFYLPGLSINAQREIASGCEQDAVDGRHSGKTVNVGFADGHVAKVQAEDLLIEDDYGHSNISPLWMP